MQEEVERMDKKFYLAAIAGIATLIVFGGCGQEADDTSMLIPTPMDVEQSTGDDFDFDFDPSVELTVTPSVDWEEAPTVTVAVEPDEEGNLPDEGDLELMNTPIPEPTATSTPTPTKEPIPTPTEEPTATPEATATSTPEPTKEEVATPVPEPTKEPEVTTPIPTVTKAAEEAKPTKAPTSTPKPTEKPKATSTPKPTKAASKDPTMEKDGYTFKDPTGLKAGAATGTVLTVGWPVQTQLEVIHHEVGDLIEAWNDGLEYDCTYLFHPEDEEHYFNKGTYELICYGKYQPKSSDKKLYFYVDKEGYCYDWSGGQWGKEASGLAANACDVPSERIHDEGGHATGEHSGTWQ